MKNLLNKIRHLKSLAIVIVLLLPNVTFATSQINLGTLDVKPVVGGEQINLDLAPGQSIQQQLRISNFSPETMQLQVYSTDATATSGNSYIANNKNQLSRDLSPWISLPTENLELASGESKILSVNINTPKTAGVGTHTGAIMVSQKISSTNASENNLVLEKGVRVYANIKGLASPALEFSGAQTTQTEKFLTYSNKVLNSGNTDLKGTFTFNLFDQKNQIVGQQEQSVYLKPGERQSLNLAIEKPAFGIFQATISNDLINKQIQETKLGSQLFIPTLASALIFGLVLALALTIGFKTIKLPKFNLAKLNISAYFQKQKLQKVLVFSLLTITIGIASFNINKIPNLFLKADLISNNQNYETTIKWGNLAKSKLPTNLRTDWNGNIKFENATISISEYLNQESNDSFEVNAEQNEIHFNNTTGPDNDGIKLIISPTSDLPIKIYYKNSLTNEQTSFPIERTIKSPKIFNFKAHQISFSSAPTSQKTETILVDANSSSEITTAESSGDVTSTIEANQIAKEINILQEVIQDLPSSPDVLSSYILNSDYVQQVIAKNQTTTINADPLLINALEETPITISDLTSSKELNFIFVPDQAVRFTPQPFSFSESKTVNQSLGQIIFVQNKTTAWNTYISVSDLVSISGKGSIPSSNVTINPGALKIISGDNENNAIQAGIAKTLSGNSDQAILASVNPTNDQETIFSLNPQFTILVPASTVPGIYKGQIYIKVL